MGAGTGPGTGTEARAGTAEGTRSGTAHGAGPVPGPGAAPGPVPGGDRTPWTRGDAFVTAAAGTIDLVGFSLGSLTEGTALGVPAALFVVVTALPLLARRIHPVPVLAAVLALGVAVNLSTPQAPHFPLSLVVALYSVVRFARPAVAAVAVAAAVPLVPLGQDGWPLPFGWWGLAGNALAALMAVGAAVAVKHRQREADAHRLLLADRAVAAERRRIARELHDIVAHHVTTMQLMAGGARANLAYDPEAAREALVTLEDSGRIALREMRRLLDVLRAGEEPEDRPAPPQPGVEDLDRLVTEARLAGTETVFTVDGEVRPLPPSVGLTVFRVVQESLTNTRKHAGEARALVRICYAGDEVSVEVRDEGTGARQPAVRTAPRSGYGLIGMHERVALQGGTLEAAPAAGGGFRVAARIPLPVPGAVAGGREERHR
ncbi:sensor histidine kinase [Streptomyces sp. NPDC047023]|uniref:sensor histidine kinase n=1 Tax=Streptomyces sp. NPDC047023 TaxID=3155139 RepID=UPI0034090939